MIILSTRQTRDGDWTYFKADDDVPRYYAVGSTGSVALADVTEIPDPDDAINRLVAEAKRLMPTSPMIVVFVHGYNNTVATAANTAQTLFEGLELAGLAPAMAFLSWSTDGKLENYIQDRSDARVSALIVSRILRRFSDNADIASGAVALDVVSHSMGNYLIDFACESMGLGGAIPTRLFHHSVLVAADINRDDLNVGQEGDLRCRMSNQVTFYYDGWDGTLALAEIVLHRQRFGKYGPHHWEQLYANTLGVNCSDVIRAHTNNPIDATWEVGVGIHSAYFADPTFYGDLKQVFEGAVPANMSTRQHPDGVPPNSFRLKVPS